MLIVYRRPAPPRPSPPTGGLPPQLWSATIPGEPVARGAASEAAMLRGVPRIVRTRRARLWQDAAMAALLNRRPRRPLAGRVALECRVWTRSRRILCDDALVGDLLERAAILADRRQIGEVHLTCATDADRPRLEICLRPLAAEAAP